MKKLTMIGLSLLALAAIGCSNTGSNNTNPASSCVMNGQYISSPYCASSLTGTGTAQQCYGTYYFYNGSIWEVGTCSGYNCSGYTLYNSAGQQVRCM